MESSLDVPVPKRHKKTHMTTLLAKFLSTKRSSEVPEAPELVAASDEFLAEFHTGFKKIEGKDDGSDSEDGESSQSECIYPKEFVMNMQIKKAATPLLSSDKNLNLADIDSEDVLIKLQLYNLPYTIRSPKEVERLGERNGVDFVKVELDIRKEDNSFAGAAKVCAKLKGVDGENFDENTTIKLMETRLDGVTCNGRLIKVRFMSNTGGKQRFSLGGSTGHNSRYYDHLGNINIKCNRCHQVGHLERDCDKEERCQPCHLCAGTDHDAASCRNIICYRCMGFGHHRGGCKATHSDIQNAISVRINGAHYDNRNSRPVQRNVGTLCTQCGSTEHIFALCPEIINHKHQDEIVSNLDRSNDLLCIFCGEENCSTCQNWANRNDKDKSTRNNSCPSCGKKGHHIDFNNNVCNKGGNSHRRF